MILVLIGCGHELDSSQNLFEIPARTPPPSGTGGGRNHGPLFVLLRPSPPNLHPFTLAENRVIFLRIVDTNHFPHDKFRTSCFESIAVRSATSPWMADAEGSIARIASYRWSSTSSARWTCSIACGSRTGITASRASREDPFLVATCRVPWTQDSFLPMCARWLDCETASTLLLSVRGEGNASPGHFLVWCHTIHY